MTKQQPQQIPELTALQKQLYSFVNSTASAVELIKREKEKYPSLEQYHKSFIDVVRGRYQIESVTKLNKTFYELRKQCNVKHRFNREYNQKISQRCYIQKMEEKEEHIVKKINQVNLNLSQAIKRNLKYLSKANGKVFEIDVNLPRLNFEKVVK